MDRVEIKSNSAITVLNAIATGIGSAIGIKANNKIIISKSNELQIQVYPKENDDRLVKSCISEFERVTDLSVNNLNIKTYSDLPPQRGLKTSSAISTAIIYGLSKINGTKLKIEEMINLAAQASINAEVSITGAIDDAYASFLGSGYITDNLEKKIIKHIEPPSGKKVILLIPREKLPKKEISNLKNEIDQEMINNAFTYAKNGKIEQAITLNTKAYAQLIFPYPALIEDLSEKFQCTVGLNGAGPSLFMIIPSENVNQITNEVNKYIPDFQLINTEFTIRRDNYD